MGGFFSQRLYFMSAIVTPVPTKRLHVQIASATVPGTEHVLPGRPNWKNNQDGFAVLSLPSGTTIAVVCDGCSDGEHSEVGAQLAAPMLVQILEEELAQRVVASRLHWPDIRNRLIHKLTQVASMMGRDLQKVVRDYFLFTTIGFIITQEDILFFYIGDGVYIVNGVPTVLGPFPDNAPPYLMYAVTGSPVFDRDPSLAYFSVRRYRTTDIKSVGVGCDGVEDFILVADHCFPGTSEVVGELGQVFTPPFFENPDRLRRLLARANKETAQGSHVEPGLLPDDTTLVIATINLT